MFEKIKFVIKKKKKEGKNENEDRIEKIEEYISEEKDEKLLQSSVLHSNDEKIDVEEDNYLKRAKEISPDDAEIDLITLKKKANEIGKNTEELIAKLEEVKSESEKRGIEYPARYILGSLKNGDFPNFKKISHEKTDDNAKKSLWGGYM